MFFNPPKNLVAQIEEVAQFASSTLCLLYVTVPMEWHRIQGITHISSLFSCFGSALILWMHKMLSSTGRIVACCQTNKAPILGLGLRACAVRSIHLTRPLAIKVGSVKQSIETARRSILLLTITQSTYGLKRTVKVWNMRLFHRKVTNSRTTSCLRAILAPKLKLATCLATNGAYWLVSQGRSLRVAVRWERVWVGHIWFFVDDRSALGC